MFATQSIRRKNKKKQFTGESLSNNAIVYAKSFYYNLILTFVMYTSYMSNSSKKKK